MPQVAALQQDRQDQPDKECRFTLQLHENADANTAANNIARCVLKAGAKLYRLQPVARGLESLFNEEHRDGS